ncbi:MAG: Gfo/Idh/MocA family oxidoreductase [Lentisphaerae bacterium]|nr:Gfo/Idh/MocA family oxidoreductase [Lentisphaerota bacterium]
MSDTIKWGVIGCGGIAARRTIPEFKQRVSNAELVSVMDADPARAEAVARQFGIPHWCASEKELLRQPLDAVYIATPLNHHCRQVIAAARAGKHILCEKPMAGTLREADRMDAACRDAGIRFMMGFCMRNNVYHKKARELVQSGALGRMVMGRAELTCWYPPIPGAWRQDIALGRGGALIDMGNHCLDILEWILGSRITEVAGFQDQLVHAYATPVEDTATTLVRFDNGAHGIVDNYFNVPDAAARNSLELYGTKGALIGQGTIGQDPTGNLYSILQPEETGYNAAQVRDVAPQRQDYRLEGIGLYGQMIDTFSRCIREGTEPPVTLADGRHSIALVQAVYQSGRKRKTISVRE